MGLLLLLALAPLLPRSALLVSPPSPSPDGDLDGKEGDADKRQAPTDSGCLMSQVAVESGSLVQEIGIPQPESPRTSHVRDSFHSPASDPSLPLSSCLLSGAEDHVNDGELVEVVQGEKRG